MHLDVAATRIVTVAVAVGRTLVGIGDVPIRAQLAKGLLSKNDGPVRIRHIVQCQRRRVVDARPEHLLAEVSIVARVHEKLVPRGIDLGRRRQLFATGSAKIEIALHVGEELLRACLIEAQLALKTCDEFVMSVRIHGFQQIRLLEGRLTMGLQGTTPVGLALGHLVTR